MVTHSYSGVNVNVFLTISIWAEFPEELRGEPVVHSAKGGRTTPTSVTIAVTNRAGVTSNTGLRNTTSRGTEPGRRQRARVAVCEYGGAIGQQRSAMRADGATGRQIVLPNRVGLRDRIDPHGQCVGHAMHGHPEIHSRRARFGDGANSIPQLRAARVPARDQRLGERTRATDSGSTSHFHVADGPNEILVVVVRVPNLFVGQAALVQERHPVVHPKYGRQDVGVPGWTLSGSEPANRHQPWSKNRRRISFTPFGFALPAVSFI